MMRNSGTARSCIVRWQDPIASAAAAARLTGMEAMQALASGAIPAPPISELMQMSVLHVEWGAVTFGCEPDESHYNPIGVVHGGLVCTVLDSVVACAVHTTLDQGMGCMSLELKVSYLAAVTAASGTLTAVGRVVKPGKRVAFAEGEVRDAGGTIVATATSTLLLSMLPPLN